MIEVRTARADELAAFAAIGAPDGGPDVLSNIELELEAGTTRLEWLYLALADGRRLARAIFSADEAPPTPPMEMFLSGLALDWADRAARGAATKMLEVALPLVGRVGPSIDSRINAEVHADVDTRRTLLESVGFGLFQEKAGYYWQRTAALPAPRVSRLRFRSLRDVDRETFIDVLAEGPRDTLDRNDRFFYEFTGAREWARIMIGALSPGDEDSWKIAYDSRGRPVGYVMLSEFGEPGVGTIVHIGVLPEQRGHGYIDDLLAETTADAEARGLEAILSDVDTLNLPMRAAMERAGHLPGIRGWHVWHYRYPAPQALSSRDLPVSPRAACR